MSINTNVYCSLCYKIYLIVLGSTTLGFENFSVFKNSHLVSIVVAVLTFNSACFHFKYSLEFPSSGNFSLGFTEPISLALLGILFLLIVNTSM